MGTVRVREQYGNTLLNVEEWMRDAECRDDDPRAYDEQYDEKPPPWVRCSTCSVQAQCLTYALAQGYEGVWGGTTYKQRNRINRRQRRAKCPDMDCNGTNIERGVRADTCRNCGLSWPVPAKTSAA